ncbi:MAG TPA: DUF6364 family protein [Spirochaetota bacterium]|nr:DUF6364 family protein [Spirochaetota bacterium]HPI91412.1 DUF6364 family protein [Spirochaetota bacterium]HPR48429.1 DUF6364 family protein [Spirochaetota bacterium]
MTQKLTLTLDNEVINNAKKYARKNNISLSKLVEFYFKSLSPDNGNAAWMVPPITRELSGIGAIAPDKSDKELLTDALNRKFL